MKEERKHNELIEAIKKEDIKRIIKLIQSGVKLDMSIERTESYYTGQIVKGYMPDGLGIVPVAKREKKTSTYINLSYSLNNAVKTGNLEIVKLLVKYSANINGEESAISTAYSAKQIHIVEYFIRNNIYPKTESLYYSLKINNIELFQWILSTRGKLNNKNKKELLERAIVENNTDFFKLVTDNISDFNDFSNQFNTLLIEAIFNDCHLKKINFFIESGADVNYTDKKGNTPLTTSISRVFMPTDFEVIKILLRNGANVNYINKDGDTPLMLAIYLKNPKLFRLLRNFNADINYKNDNGHQLLLLAIKPLLRSEKNIKNNLEIIELLIKCGIDLNNNQGGYSALTYAVKRGRIEVLNLLIKNKVDLNAVDGYGVTPIVYAKKNKKERILNILRKAGAITNEPPLKEIFKNLKEMNKDLNKIDKKKENILIKAVKAEDIELVKLITNENVDLEIRDKYGLTALISAIKLENYEIVSLLINKGADVFFINDFNYKYKNVKQYAEDTKNSKIITLIKKYYDERDKKLTDTFFEKCSSSFL